MLDYSEITNRISPKYLKEIMERIKKSVPGVQALSLNTREGLPVASVQITTVDDALLSAMSATIHAVSEKAIVELQSGDLEAIIVQGATNYIMLISVGSHAVLTVLANKEAQIGLLHLVLVKIVEEIAQKIEN